jgi:YebC/PmpR family DNA-binding regulatory protein
MSGHSKWHNIKLRKGKQDAERGRAFTKLGRELVVAAKGGSNPDVNVRLRFAIQKAREASMPADTIKRAVMKGAGELEGQSFEECTYEGYGPGGVGIIVECMTDNKNRTFPEVRNAFTKNNGRIAETGSVSWSFSPFGVITILKEDLIEDSVMEAALEAGADDMNVEEEMFEILTSPGNLMPVRIALDKAGLKVESAEVAMIPSTTVEVHGKDAELTLRLIDLLEDNDDVQAVWSNFDISDDELAAIL